MDEAKRRTARAVETALAAGADALAANGKVDLAAAFSSQHEYEEALVAVREALALAQRNRNRQAEARAKLVLASVLIRLGRPAEARESETAAFAFYRAGGHRAPLINAAILTADRLIEESQTDREKLAEVMERAREAEAAARAAGDARAETLALGRVMHVHLLNADFPGILETAQRQERLQVELGQPPDLLQVVYPLWSLGREAEARAALERAAAQRRALPGSHPRLEFRELYQHLFMAFQQADWRRAVDLADRCLAFPDDVASELSKTWTRGMRVTALEASGRGAEAQDDRRRLEQAAAGPPGSVRAQALLGLTEAAFARGDLAEVRRRAPAALAASRIPLSLDRSLWLAWMAARAGVAGAATEAEKLWTRLTAHWPPDDRQRYLARPYIQRLRGPARQGDQRSL